VKVSSCAFAASSPSFSSVQGSSLAGFQGRPAGSIHDAELVFVGCGIQAPEYNWDDVKGMDLRGKVLLMLNKIPTGTGFRQYLQYQ